MKDDWKVWAGEESYDVVDLGGVFVGGFLYPFEVTTRLRLLR